MPASAAEPVFVERLEEQVKQSIRTLLQRQERTVYPDPNESTLLTIPPSVSTAMAPSVRETLSSAGGGIDAKSECSPDTEDSDTTIGDIELMQYAGSNIQPEPLTEEFTEISPLVPAASLLIPGNRSLITVKANESSKLYEAWPLRLQIEYSVGESIGKESHRSRSLTCYLTWLDPNTANTVKQKATAKIIDGERIDGEIQLGPSDLEELYISAGDTMLQVHLA